MSRPWLAAAALGLFLIWSNSFVAIGFLLGADRAGARFDFVGLTVARFLLAAPVCAAYAWRHRGEAGVVLRGHWRRVLLCGGFAVPAYNLALYYAQQHGVPAPIASLTTTLLPLFVMVLAAAFLRERVTGRKMAGFAISVVGMGVIASARRGETGTVYAVLVALAAVAPLSWSLYSVLSKPVAGRVPPLLWTYLAVTVGAVLLLPLLPGRAWEQWRALDAPGWLALAYLSFPCTVLGFALWTWLLRHLPASTLGLTVFLNPPLTAMSKLVLAAAVPSVFVFSVNGQELAGGLLALTGLAVAVLGRARSRRGARS